LLVIATQTSLFQWSFSLIISGIIVTLLGLAMLTTLFRDAGDTTFSYLALIVLLFGDVLFVIYIAFPLGIAPLAAQETVKTGVVPDYYVQLTLWTQPLFVIYTILAFSVLAAYGGAILSTRVLPHWIGWLAIIYSLAGLVLAGLAAGNVPPLYSKLRTSPLDIGLEQGYTCSIQLLNAPGNVQSLHPARPIEKARTSLAPFLSETDHERVALRAPQYKGTHAQGPLL
jgi:hypothetical protein